MCTDLWFMLLVDFLYFEAFLTDLIQSFGIQVQFFAINTLWRFDYCFLEITILVLINLSLIILTKVKIQVETVALNSSTSLSAYCKLRELCMLMCSIKLRPKLVDIKSILKTTISSTKSAILFSKPSNWAWRLSNNAVMIRLSGVVLPANYNFDLMIEVNLPGQGVLCEHSVEFNNCW